MLKKYYGELGLILASIIWGSGYIATKISLDGGLTTFQVMTLRFFVGALIMNVVFFKHMKKNVNKKVLFQGVILGIMLFLSFSLQTMGLIYTTASKNAFITAANVIIVPFISLAVYKNKLNIYSIIGSFLTLFGIGILSLEADFSLNIGDILTLLGALGFAVQIFMTGEFVKGSSPIVLTSIQITVSCILSAIVQSAIGEWHFTANNSAYLSVLFLGVFSTSVCYILQTSCQKFVDETKTAIILSTEAVFGTVFSIFFLGEKVTMKLIIGSILIFIAILLAETKLAFLKNLNKSS